MEPYCPSHQRIFDELNRIAPNAPFLALGQTAFWDEPMKAGVALCSRQSGYDRRFVAGIHDSDYFAKHTEGVKPGTYGALPHNDTTTRELWSAAGEFSALFGSETVITREKLNAAGAKLGKVQRSRPYFLDELTEAYGWRGVVFGGDQPPVIAETPMRAAGGPVLDALHWALDATLESVIPCARPGARARADHLISTACDLSGEHELGTLAEFYQAMLPKLYEFAAGEPVDLETTRTTELLRFNRSTAALARFGLVDLFLRPETRTKAHDAYNQAVRGSEIYTLDRFGSWAVPFDLVIAGKGRGTLRIAPKAVIVMTPVPQFITLKKPIESVADLAEAIERKFGPNCTLVGKAVSLIGMLASEFIFVFHEGASGYVPRCRKMHQHMIAAGLPLNLNPILRVKYDTWTALSHCKQWIRLPGVLQQPFGAEDLSTESFASRWKTVVQEEAQRLKDLAQLRRPIELFHYLDAKFSHSWSELTRQYEAVHDRLEELRAEIETLKESKQRALAEWRAAKQERAAAERRKGDHWRAAIFEKEPTEADFAERERLSEEVRSAAEKATAALARWREIQQQQDTLVGSDEIVAAHTLRRDLELEAELKRLKLVRQAITVTQGLVKASHRPSAWWFPVLCPDGGWFRDTVNTAEYYLEPLQ